MKKLSLLVITVIVSLNFLTVNPQKISASTTSSLAIQEEEEVYRYEPVLIQDVWWMYVYLGETLVYSYPIEGDY